MAVAAPQLDSLGRQGERLFSRTWTPFNAQDVVDNLDAYRGTFPDRHPLLFIFVFPMETLVAVSLAYLGSIPFAVRRYRALDRVGAKSSPP